MRRLKRLRASLHLSKGLTSQGGVRPLGGVYCQSLSFALRIRHFGGDTSASRRRTSPAIVRVRVDDTPWAEVRSLDTCGPNDRVYVLRINPDGEATVEFGDGVCGMGLPSAIDNITATYRPGAGQGDAPHATEGEPEARADLVYLDVSTREMSAKEDDERSQPASGVDTTPRTKGIA
jgi:hypothetical protein